MDIESKQIALEDSRTVTFRPVAPDDEPFLVSVYGSTRTEELSLTDWDEARRDAFVAMQFKAQQSHYREYYPNGQQLIILVNDDAVGRLYVANIKEEIRILDITILPQHRNEGIGTPIVKELMAEAAKIGKPLRIFVESYNRSRLLFERLGFVKIDESGYSYLLEWRAGWLPSGFDLSDANDTRPLRLSKTYPATGARWRIQRGTLPQSSRTRRGVTRSHARTRAQSPSLSRRNSRHSTSIYEPDALACAALHD